MKAGDYVTQSRINLRFNAWLMQMCDEVDDCDYDLNGQIDLFRIPGMRERCLKAYKSHKHGGVKRSCFHVACRLQDCGSYAITSGTNEDWRKNDVVAINYCCQRYCSLCEMKKSRKKSMRLTYKVDQAIKSGEYELFLLTLTVPNVEGGFRAAFDGMRKAVNKMLKTYGHNISKAQYDCIPGIYGQFETTIDEDGNYHPHLHLMFAIRKSDVIDYQEDRYGYCKNLQYYSNKCKTKILTIDNYRVSSDWKDICRSIDPETFRETKDPKDGYIVQLRKCYNLDGIHELTKYLCNLYDIRTKEQFITYCKDTYGLRDTISCGVLGFKESVDQAGFEAWLAARRSTDDGLTVIGENTKVIQLQFVKRVYYGRLSKFNIFWICEKDQFRQYIDEKGQEHFSTYQNFYGKKSPGQTFDEVTDAAYDWERAYSILDKYFRYNLDDKVKQLLINGDPEEKELSCNELIQERFKVI